MKHWPREMVGPEVPVGDEGVAAGAGVEPVDGALVASVVAPVDGWLVTGDAEVGDPEVGDAAGDSDTPDFASLMATSVCWQMLSRLASWVELGVVPGRDPVISIVLPPLASLKKLD